MLRVNLSRNFSDPGSRDKIQRKMIFDDDGRTKFVESGKFDLANYIDSYRQSTDINYLIEMYEHGDTSALMRAQAIYGDFSNLPSSYSDLLNTVHEAETAFKGLPLDLRNKFGNDFNRFFSSLGSSETQKIISTFYGSPASAAADPSPVLNNGGDNNES